MNVDMMGRYLVMLACAGVVVFIIVGAAIKTPFQAHFDPAAMARQSGDPNRIIGRAH
jgi:hypothetical protein